MSFFIKSLLTITANYRIFAPFLPLFRANKKTAGDMLAVSVIKFESSLQITGL